MHSSSAIDFELTLQTLNYATRLLAAELDRERVVERALDTLADFGRSPRVALLTLEEGQRTVEVAGRLEDGSVVDLDHQIIVAGSPLETVVRHKRPAIYAAAAEEPIPLPTTNHGQPGMQCLCLPLIGSSNRVLGVVTMERPIDDPLNDQELQVLSVLQTLTAVALENARLFKLATVDGLTGLYVRRYFEIRLQEEVARVKRQGGVVSVIMTDIDHFKQFNDTYGHQTGDMVLREVAGLFRAGTRIGVDIVCRYGGEEYVIILPGTDLEGARLLAERLRVACGKHEFPGPSGPLHVQLSAGVAACVADQAIEPDQLVHRADMKLYEAKEGGRNRVCVWTETSTV